LDELQQRCRSLDNAVTHGESEKRDLLEHLAKLVKGSEERDAKLKEQVAPSCFCNRVLRLRQFSCVLTLVCLVQLALEAQNKMASDAAAFTAQQIIQKLSSDLDDRDRQLDAQLRTNQALADELAVAAQAQRTQESEHARTQAELQVDGNVRCVLCGFSRRHDVCRTPETP
jgi:flagellar biosynthesis regulator FlaF